MNKNSLTAVLFTASAAGIIGLSAITSSMNCQGREYLIGTVAKTEDNCKALRWKVPLHESRLSECDYTLEVKTEEGTYTIGVRGHKNIQPGDKIKFLKQSTHYVTSFHNKKGYLTEDNLEKIIERK